MGRSIRIGFAFTFLLVALGASSPLLIDIFRPKAALPTLGQVKHFSLTSSEGKNTNAQTLRGKVWVAHLFFASCKGPCPVMTSHVGLLSKTFQKSSDVHFLSVTVDPETDTPEKLSAHAKTLSADLSRWHFLTGEIEEITRLAAEEFHFGTLEKPKLHSNRFVLIDREGNIRGYYHGTERSSVAKLAKDIRLLL